MKNRIKDFLVCLFAIVSITLSSILRIKQSSSSLQVRSVSWADLFANNLIEMIQTAPVIINEASSPIVSVVERPESYIHFITSNMLTTTMETICHEFNLKVCFNILLVGLIKVFSLLHNVSITCHYKIQLKQVFYNK